MKPPRTKMEDCLKPFLAEIKELQRGWFITLPGESTQSFVIGSLGVCIADMPQALALAGCQHQSSSEPCRRCGVKKGPELGDATFNIESSRRTQQGIVAARESNGIGCGMCYMVPLVCGWEYFPDRRGLVTGIVISAYGFGAFGFGLLAVNIINPDHLNPTIQVDYQKFYT